jgi:membrane fusion protein (multidrug efflux system)
MTAISEKPAATVSDAQTPATPLARPPRRLRRTLLRAGIAGALLVAAAGVGTWWLNEARWIESTDNAYVQGDIAVLGPRIEGDVMAIHVTDNQLVHAGDPLITLDPADWRARLDQARGIDAEAAAAIVTARRQVEQAAASIKQSEAMIAQAQAEMTRATADAGRSGALVSAGWASRQANDQAVADRNKATAAVAAMRAQEETARSALAVAEAQVTQAEAKKLTQDAAVKLAERSLDYTVIRAPFDGVVGNRAAQLGQHVNPTLQLISVTPLRGQLYVIANFKETQLRRMQPGQKVVLTPDIDSSAAIDAQVDSLAPATGALYSLLPPENATGNFTKVVQRVPVKITIDPAVAANATWLRAGLSVTAEVDTRGPDAVRHGLIGTAAAAVGLE